MIYIGIIGHGFMGHEHAKMLANMPAFRVAAIADIDPEMLADIGEGIIRCESAEELVAIPDIQVVIIAANNNRHRDLVIMAAEHGKDIICEKPVALSLDELDDMERACEKNNVRFTVHQQRRYDQDFRVMKEVFDGDTLGEVYSVKSSLYGFNGNMHDWHVFPEEGGGMLYDWGVHLIDQMLWMIPGKIKTVFADVRNVINADVDDYFKILLRFENGIAGEIELGTYFLADRERWFERHWMLAGNKGSAYADGFDPVGKICRTTRLLTNAGDGRTMTAAGPTRSFGPPPDGVVVTEELPKVNTKHSDFFANYEKAYRGEEPFLVQIPQVRRVLRLMEAVRESSRTGTAITFE